MEFTQGNTREALTEVEIGGYQLARGSLVAISPYVTQPDPRWFFAAEFSATPLTKACCTLVPLNYGMPPPA